MAYLVLTEGAAQGKKFDLKAGVTRIGRRAENDAVIECASVSGAHAEIIRTGSLFELRDLGSTNGTRRNGERIQNARLYRNDILTFGDVFATIDGDDVPTEPTGESAEISPIPRTTVIMHPLVPENARVIPPDDFKPMRVSHALWPILLGLIILAVAVAFVIFILGSRSP